MGVWQAVGILAIGIVCGYTVGAVVFSIQLDAMRLRLRFYQRDRELLMRALKKARGNRWIQSL